MTMATAKTIAGVVPVPRALSNIAVSVGLLALFLIAASVIISHPFASSFPSYLLGVDRYKKPAPVPVIVDRDESLFLPPPFSPQSAPPPPAVASSGSTPPPLADSSESEPLPPVSPESAPPPPAVVSSGSALPPPVDSSESEPLLPNSSESEPLPPSSSEPAPQLPNGSVLVTGSNDGSAHSDGRLSTNVTEDPVDGRLSSNATEDLVMTPDSNGGSQKVDSKRCDLFHGQWVYDSAGPLYTNNTCPLITQMQNCQGNGRPDKEYENWRWSPHQCSLPRFDGKKFLEMMRGKTLAFIGDSVARNQMESLVCILWQVETPKNRGNRHMQRWFFKSTSTFITRIWSSWLVHKTSEPFQFAPQGLDKVHLDLPDETFMEFLPNFDVVVLSSGHWFAKRSAYILNNNIVGGQLWWPKEAPGRMQVDNVEAFGLSVETALSAIAAHPNFTGLAIVRSFSPDHYEGGAWNTGGSCTGKVRPTTELVSNGFTNKMHGKQVAGFERAVEKAGNEPSLRLMDITDVFSYRPDGHPGPYRSPDPNKKTKRGPNGEPPPQDCLHWCMPGPIDTWNEMLMEMIRREYEG